jgi:hypothetical protein
MARTLTALVGALVVVTSLVGAGVVVADFGPDGAPQQVSPAESTDGPARTIQVSATGSAQAEPDTAIVRLSVEAVTQDPTTARNQVANNVTRLKEALSDAGIDADRIRTTDFDLRERRDRSPGPEKSEETVEYWASHDLVVEIEAVDRVGELVDTAIDNGATNVEDVQFTLSDDTRKELRTEALKAAMSNARQQAGTIASSADLSIAGVASASTTNVHLPTRSVTMEAAGDAGGGTDISSGPVSVGATVSVTYNATAG